MRTRAKLTIGICILIFIPIGYFYCGNFVGYLCAKYDISRSKPRHIIYGELFPNEEIIYKILSEQYQIQATRISGCQISIPELEFAKSYNNEIVEFSIKKYKKDVISETYEKLEQYNKKNL